ncbi:DNA-(apurinic or apyrimidinic site) lyase /Formamidopyrimidine-DNA glycosylase [Streptomyces zhaozhouensis]|uniref:DNA-(Apurinic or apyrimidinic site) lyase /Formamidopyrimidine-DNA glycosylase n=1 Tax=Streptomyces zhaozhouensis TaxID=1300267 RepID=A0A286E4W0_9ACTN|nr:DNA-formamidopyrimidine glycosylase family protein [Streptomyces zhaozhouensis]SOD65936.1 DNA-(apurinic or apyrimidinic site) lyase /Formamidopyrimidine-DNA glycosylase [Streptomyces zhaozhouensis]
MPELPEVAALRDLLDDRLAGQTVARVAPVAFHVLKTYDPPLDAVAGRTFTAVARHGKFLDLVVDDELHLVIHLARAGWLRWRETQPAAPPRPGRGPLALRLTLAGGAGFDLTEAGTQKRLAVHCVRDPAEVPGVARLGPDPLGDDFTEETLAALLRGEHHRLKGVLRDQSVLAGVGNAYSDEILHAARMSPFQLADRLDADGVARLYRALRDTLDEAVDRARGLAAGELKAEKKSGLRVHGRTGQPCPVCGDTIREVAYRDSSLQYCPRCQTGGRPLADRRLSRLLR